MAGSNNNADRDQRALAVKPETVEKFIELQTREQGLRQQELAIRAKELEHQAKHAGEMLAAQERDLEKDRGHNRVMTRTKLVFAAFVLVIVLAFIFEALRMNKDAFVMEVLKLAVTFFAGGAGGYGVAKISGPGRPEKPDSSDS